MSLLYCSNFFWFTITFLSFICNFFLSLLRIYGDAMYERTYIPAYMPVNTAVNAIHVHSPRHLSLSSFSLLSEVCRVALLFKSMSTKAWNGESRLQRTSLAAGHYWLRVSFAHVMRCFSLWLVNTVHYLFLCCLASEIRESTLLCTAAGRPLRAIDVSHGPSPFSRRRPGIWHCLSRTGGVSKVTGDPRW